MYNACPRNTADDCASQKVESHGRDILKSSTIRYAPATNDLESSPEAKPVPILPMKLARGTREVHLVRSVLEKITNLIKVSYLGEDLSLQCLACPCPASRAAQVCSSLQQVRLPTYSTYSLPTTKMNPS
jgi:hypothetical protein